MFLFNFEHWQLFDCFFVSRFSCILFFLRTHLCYKVCDVVKEVGATFILMVWSEIRLIVLIEHSVICEVVKEWVSTKEILLLLLALHPTECLLEWTTISKDLLEWIITTKEVGEEIVVSIVRTLRLKTYIASEWHLLISKWKVCTESKWILLLSLVLLSLKFLFLTMSPRSFLLFLLYSSPPLLFFLNSSPLLLSLLFSSEVLSGSYIWRRKWFTFFFAFFSAVNWRLACKFLRFFDEFDPITLAFAAFWFCQIHHFRCLILACMADIRSTTHSDTLAWSLLKA